MNIIKTLALIKKIIDMLPGIIEFIEKILQEFDQFKLNKVK